MNEVKGAIKRDEWDIKEDCRALERALEVLNDPERLNDVKEMQKKKRNAEKAMDALLDGDIAAALGMDKDNDGV